MEIVLIRHFMTQGNAEHRYIGVTDESLLPGGNVRIAAFAGVSGQDDDLVTVADLRGKRYFYPGVRAVAVSPLKRCIETAEIIYPGVRRYICEELRECDFGLFENRNYEELKDDPDYQRWLLSEGRIPFPKGEGRDEFCRRCVEGFCRMTERFMEEAYESVAFVVHGGTIMAILDRLAVHQEGFYHWQVQNGEAYRAKLCETEWRSGLKRLTEIERV